MMNSITLPHNYIPYQQQNGPGLLQKKNEWEASTADYYAPFVVK